MRERLQSRPRNLRTLGLAALTLAGLTLLACGDEDTTDGAGPGTGASGEVLVSGELTQDATWTTANIYRLTDLVFVTGGATLTIEAGTTILGDGGSGLIVTRDGSIDAQGTAQAPIVFTSSKSVGERRRGDWGGVVLLGDAPINVPNGQIEGIESSDARGAYGGSDSTSDCGTIRYARIEFAGFTIGADNELNGLTLGGCGSDTTIEYVQVHMGDDDGIEFFGGSANLRHIVITRAADDSLDWDEGWQGKVQYLVIQQEGAEGDNGFEADNLEDNNDATPRSAPRLYNVTMVGSNDPNAEQRAMTIRRGTAGVLRNFVITGFPVEAIDVRDESTVAQLDDGNLSFDNMLFFDIGADGQTYFATESGDGDDDGGFVEADYFNNGLLTCAFGTDPELADPFDLTAPSFTPSATGGANENFATPPDDGFFDISATFLGAVEPGVTTSWLDGWTAFPAN